jgi:hypothetical protein
MPLRPPFRAADLGGWHRPGESDAANRHDFEVCTAEASDAAANSPHEPSLSDDNLPFGSDPSSYFVGEPRVMTDPEGGFSAVRSTPVGAALSMPRDPRDRSETTRAAGWRSNDG